MSFQGNNLAIIEAKKLSKNPLDSLQQGIHYAKDLNVRFVYVSNGEKIYEYDLKFGRGAFIDDFPSPQSLFHRIFGTLAEWQNTLLTQKEAHMPDKPLRYYQKVAIDKVVESLINGKDRILLTLATGTGKTAIAFHLCYRLLEARWNKSNTNKKPKILFLCDRVTLRDQAFNEFNVIENDCVQINSEEIKKRNGKVPTNANVFFAIYQSLSASDRNDDTNSSETTQQGSTDFYLQYDRDFFDMIIIDECHRGGANQNGSWKEILEYFSLATHIGLTATPKKDSNVDTYKYFGEAVFEYSLKSGIEDGFLCPYKVKRITSTLSEGYVYNPDDLIQGELEKGHYALEEFERKITIPKYDTFIAKKILELINPMDKTIIFCVNQAHASNIKDAIDRHKADSRSDYCVRVTSDEGEIGLAYLRAFQDNDKAYPVILTSSKMLTTGVNARNVRNIILLANIGSIVEFKQIIGRGTRVYEGKDFFTIIDFIGVTKLFYDPKWDGEQITDESPQSSKDSSLESHNTKEPNTYKPQRQKPLFI